MNYLKNGNLYLIRLEKGEEITEKILEFCRDQNIDTAVFNGIGAVLSAEIGFYNLEIKEYSFKKLDTPNEIVSLTGNVSLVDEKPFIHMHCVLSNNNFKCFGGHLKSAIIGATCEICLRKLDAKVERKQNEGIGLNLLDFKEN